ncbi:MAG: hypothetical protein QOE05_2102 [Actinomycetota bacterium]|nr:hypothetical protein [Actinomycetota bacterium]
MLPPKLQLLADAQAGAFKADQAREHELDVASHRRAGRLTVVRKRVYAVTAYVEALEPPAVAALHASARLLVSSGDLVASHATAAAIHDFRLRDSVPVEPQLTQALGDPTVCGRRSFTVAALPAEHRCRRFGVAVTTPERTVADCARSLSAQAAVVTADSALRAGVSRDDITEVLQRCSHWPGVRQARAVVAFADARSDSALESALRWQFAQQGLPAPDLQITICDAEGGQVGDVDFVWLARRTICEADGRLKYDEKDGPRKENALWREKRREDALRWLGFEVVRAYWDDLKDEGAGVAARIRAAFALNAARAALPDFGYFERAARKQQRAA